LTRKNDFYKTSENSYPQTGKTSDETQFAYWIDLGTLDDFEDVTMVVGCPAYIKEGAF
jgi:hypothetical protein